MAWQEVVNMPRGHVAARYDVDGLPVMIRRGGVSLCAYVGIPLSHPLARRAYDDVDVNCHGGLTFSEKGHEEWHEDYWWYGWDYGHLGDAMVGISRYGDDREWTVEDVKAEIPEVVSQFKRLMAGWR